ncbi:DegT/DnrJ/EryC1/StrS family aminotransferase [Streptomyces sp. NBC_01142]|uniref:DegT/DnrJ/EryC1/StrS family aminotransferase n=1 Tax=Streptomyces sp. NBC_01142 TaxID=2975865 RepID=UPI002255B092|nr:DegT/DnrJ/EryC1/StrS family aminotransferase [Streptomyces sp. NBC_01142]MCX4820766.1 DegT/DnrJ/EryC1/StrS family aminotransferase [Streptomyces sp. NBC_01142]
MSDAVKLAMFGGSRTVGKQDVSKALVGWPVVTDQEQDALRGVLDRGLFTSNDAGRGEVSALQQEWAQYVGTQYCAAVANGTAALELSLAALDIEPGSEVLVPALTFIGSAAPIVQRQLVPVFVDIDPVTYTMDPVAAEKAVTGRTRALIAVHLHGLPCDMGALRALADRHGLYVIEDAAQAQGAEYGGRRAGSLGDINAVSLNAVKNLPTCGEGGLVTTNDENLHERVVLRRQFGEDLRPGRERDYISRVLAGNEKMSAVQAAFTRCQLSRLDSDSAARDRVVRRFLGRLSALPGVIAPTCPDDRTHAWHILRLRFDPAAAGFPELPAGQFRAMLQRALRAEGVPLQSYQIVPLPGQPAFQHLGVPIADYQVSMAVIDESVTLQRWHLNPNCGPVLDLCASAFEKVWARLDELAPLAAAMNHRPPWHQVMSGAAR